MSNCKHLEAKLIFTDDGTRYFACKSCGTYSTYSERVLYDRINILEAALTVSRGQWIHSVNADQCLAALGSTRDDS